MEKVDAAWIRERLGAGERGDQTRLAKHMGIDQTRLSRILTGRRKLLADEVPAVVDFFRRRGVAVPEADSDGLEHGSAGGDLVPVYDVYASAGPGEVPPDYEPLAYQLRFPIGYLGLLTSTNPRHLQTVGVRGDSMEPTLRSGDLVVLDTTRRNIGGDGLFVLRFDGALAVKRTARTGQPGRVLIISDNRALYPAADYAIADVHVIGEVIAAVRRMT